MGHPISHSTNIGFNCGREVRGCVEDGKPGISVVGSWSEKAAACPFSSISPDRSPERVIRPPVVSATDGVCQRCATKFGSWSRCKRPVPFSRWFAPFAPLKSRAAGVGHREDEEPFPPMARANFLRREQSALNLETQSA